MFSLALCGTLLTSECCVLCSVIIVGIYLLSKHGEGEIDDLDGPELSSPLHLAHLTGHFGALIPLSPQGRSYSTFGRKSFDDRESEYASVRYTPLKSRVFDRNGHSSGCINEQDHGQAKGKSEGEWHGPHGRRHHDAHLEEQPVYSGSI